MTTTASTSIAYRKHPLFVAAVALGAFLTFLIQPLAARALLPAFGGSGSVWVTALVFYQVVLAAGYLLAHFFNTRLTMRGQTSALVLLSVGALLTLSVLPKPIAVGSGSSALHLLLTLAVSVGPPLLVLTVASPLVQAWAATQGGGMPGGRDIYSLCAISSGASLVALASYPSIVEPLWGISQQGRIWDGLFAVEVVLLVAISGRIWSTHRAVAKPERASVSNAKSRRSAMHPNTLRWMCWSAAGVMVLTSTSALIGQEIAAIPLLWVIPLSLYLVTWIVAFSGAVRPGEAARGWLTLVALILLILAVDIRLSVGFVARIGCALAGMTLACFAVHAALYHLRPHKLQLTRFYAAVAVGGAIGGVLAGVVAIQIFQDWRDLGLAFSMVALLACSGLISHRQRGKTVLLHRGPTVWLAGALAVGCCCLLAVTSMERPGLLYKHRDFHGLVRVVEEGAGNPQRHRLVMYNGSTLHGSQFMNPPLQGSPTTYFGRGTGAEIAVQTQRDLVGAGNSLNIGTIGLGVGTMAAHTRAQDSMRFYELSPVIAALARQNRALGDSGHHFSYLGDAAGEIDVVIGDARLSLVSELAKRPAGNSFDLLVLDAFSGDAVPTHLLTREAFTLFTKHLTDTGMIAAHVSSNWLDLVPVIYAWAESEHWQALTISTRAGAGGVSGNNAVWVLLFRNQETLRILAQQCRPLMAEGKIMVQNLANIDYGNLTPWTDGRSDLLAVMRSRIRLREQ